MGASACCGLWGPRLGTPITVLRKMPLHPMSSQAPALHARAGVQHSTLLCSPQATGKGDVHWHELYMRFQMASPGDTIRFQGAFTDGGCDEGLLQHWVSRTAEALTPAPCTVHRISPDPRPWSSSEAWLCLLSHQPSCSVYPPSLTLIACSKSGQHAVPQCAPGRV